MKLTVVPAYNRDYKTADKVQKDWDDDKDFKIADVSSPYNGSYINKQDAESQGISEIKVRFNKLTDFVIFTIVNNQR